MYRGYLTVSVAIALLTVLCAASVNFYADPANLFDSRSEYESAIAKHLLENHNITNISNHDERITQQLYINALTQPPDIIVLGSSRSLQIRSNIFPKHTFFNHAVSGGSLEDHMAIYEMYHSRGLIPQTVILGLDPWIFNINNGQTRWKSISQYLNEIGDRLSIHVPFQPTTDFNNTTNKYLQLFSFAYFEESLSFLWRKFNREDIKIRVTDNTHLIRNTKLSDGSLVYGASIRNRGVKNVRIRAAANARRGAIYALGNFSSLDGSTMRALDSFIQSIQADGANPVVFLPPYHPAAYEVIRSDAHYFSVLESERYLRQLGQDRDIDVIGSYDPELAPCTESEFTDDMHPTDECINRIFGR